MARRILGRCLALAVVLPCGSGDMAVDMLDFEEEEDRLALDMSNMLQMNLQLTPGENTPRQPAAGRQDLVMAYLPYNFGHTVAEVAMRTGIQWGDCGQRVGTGDSCIGHARSAITGCELMYTPGKYWPKDLAQEYFASKAVFGILRDPYERMVAQFRGSGRYEYPELYEACDVNTAIKRKMRTYMASSNPFANNCQQLPQAEFFDQPFGITLPIDNRRFPESANELLQSHGYSDVFIQHKDVAHVSGCDHVWAGDLDAEARALIRQVYARDFDLLCTYFGYCDSGESICLTHIEGMCPEHLFEWNSSLQLYVKK